MLSVYSFITFVLFNNFFLILQANFINTLIFKTNIIVNRKITKKNYVLKHELFSRIIYVSIIQQNNSLKELDKKIKQTEL